MQKPLEVQIARAQELLKNARHAAMATVNEDGSPHNSPFLFMYDATLEHTYWGSHPDSEHSKNILRTGQLYVVLYEANARGGLYIEAKNGHTLEGDELENALKIHNDIRAGLGLDPLTLEYYQGDSPQRMWSADITRLWVNSSQRGPDGRIIQDIRTEISAQALLQ